MHTFYIQKRCSDFLRLNTFLTKFYFIALNHDKNFHATRASINVIATDLQNIHKQATLIAEP